MKKLIFIFLLFANSCTNPFAPKLSENKPIGSILGDQRTVKGLFDNFRYAYMFKDTLVYGSLLDNNFRFIFRNYENGIDESWGRTEDMITTSRLFLASKSIDLTWNDVTNSVSDSILMDISRAFNLTIVFSTSDIVNVFGRVNMRIARKKADDNWKIIMWRDESNF